MKQFGIAVNLPFQVSKNVNIISILATPCDPLHFQMKNQAV